MQGPVCSESIGMGSQESAFLPPMSETDLLDELLNATCGEKAIQLVYKEVEQADKSLPQFGPVIV